ncbi:MAG: phospholipid carrier-dependent glycosyltransferase [Chromatiales bacterium]|nr:phospholipid carrier-dependent glycosyltransferase [Chromatiales bacterium]
MERRRRVFGSFGAGVLLLIGYVAVYLLPLNVRPLARMDEFRYAEIAREMLASGDWVTPRLNGLRYFEKPVLGHWVEAASLAAFGETSLATRLPSALATAGTALFIGLLAFRLTRNRATGVLAAFIHLTTLAVFGIGTINILDPVLSLWLTLAIGCYLWAVQEEATGTRRLLKVLAGIACGLAFLTKGFLALVIPLVVIVPFLAWQGLWRELLAGLWLPFTAALLVALPWSLLIHQAEPDFWRYFFWEEHIRRFASEDAQHARPFWLFLAVFPAMALPWTSMLPAAIRGLREQHDARVPVLFLALWLLLPLLFFSVSRGKLLTYILPCFPPLSILLAIGLSGPKATGTRGGLRWVGVVWSLLLVVLLLNRFAGVGKPFYDDTEILRWAAVAAALATGLVICGLGLRSTRSRWHVMAAGASIVPLLVAVPFVIPNATRLSKMPGEFLAPLVRDVPADAVVISDGVYIHPVAWALKRSDILMLSTGELEYGLSYPGDRQRLLTPEGLESVLKQASGRNAAFIAVDVNQKPMVTETLARTWPASGISRVESDDLVVWTLSPARPGSPGNPPPPPSE